MTINLKKCSLSLQINGEDDIEYSIFPKPDSITKSKNLINCEFNVSLSNVITIEVLRRRGNYSHILVNRFEVDGVEMNLNNISLYRTKTKTVKKSYNFIDEEGTFQLKIHSNPISQNYLSYLLDLTK
jgi:hypothetical protein